jgi:hypothetical protein
MARQRSLDRDLVEVLIIIVILQIENLLANLVALLQQSADLSSRQPLVESAPSFRIVAIEQRLFVLIDYFLDLFIKPLQLARIERCDVS